MGNAALLMCHEATAAAVGRCPGNAVGTAAAAAAAAAVPAAAHKQGEKVARPVGQGRRGAEQQAGGGGGGAATLVTVKVVMTRKEAERLIARLNEQGARERRARMAALKGQLRAGDGSGSSAPCRGSRTPHLLAPIRED